MMSWACPGFGLAALSWLMFVITFAVELGGNYTPKRSWLRRMPAVLICAGEIAKLRCAPRTCCLPRFSGMVLACDGTCMRRHAEMVPAYGGERSPNKTRLHCLSTASLAGIDGFPHGYHRSLVCNTLCASWCRFVLQLDRTRAYFFWMYVGYCGCEALLATLALLWYPPKSQLLLWSPHDEGYLVRPHR